MEEIKVNPKHIIHKDNKALKGKVNVFSPNFESHKCNRPSDFSDNALQYCVALAVLADDAKQPYRRLSGFPDDMSQPCRRYSVTPDDVLQPCERLSVIPDNFFHLFYLKTIVNIKTLPI